MEAEPHSFVDSGLWSVRHALAEVVDRVVDDRAAGASKATSARESLEAARRLRASVDDLIRRLVEQSREDGLTWAQIGDALMVSRQAVHRYYYAKQFVGGRVKQR